MLIYSLTFFCQNKLATPHLMGFLEVLKCSDKKLLSDILGIGVFMLAEDIGGIKHQID